MECGKTTKLKKGKAPRVSTEPRDVLSRTLRKNGRQRLQLDVQPPPNVHSLSAPDVCCFNFNYIIASSY